MEAPGLVKELELAEHQQSTGDKCACTRQSALTLYGNAPLELPRDIMLATNGVEKIAACFIQYYFLASPNTAGADEHVSLTLVRSIYSSMSPELLLCC